jgi:hypothetical protein
VERAEADGLFIAEAGRVGGGFGQRATERTAAANGGVRADVGAVREGDVGRAEVSRGRGRRGKREGIEREVFWCVLPRVSVGFWAGRFWAWLR